MEAAVVKEVRGSCKRSKRYHYYDQDGHHHYRDAICAASSSSTFPAISLGCIILGETFAYVTNFFKKSNE